MDPRDFTKNITAVLRALPLAALTCLNLCKQTRSLDLGDVDALSLLCSTATNLRSLSLSFWLFVVSQAETACASLATLSELQNLTHLQLDMDWPNVSDEISAALLSSTAALTALQSLRLIGVNQLPGSSSTAALLARHTALTELTVSVTGERTHPAQPAAAADDDGMSSTNGAIPIMDIPWAVCQLSDRVQCLRLGSGQALREGDSGRWLGQLSALRSLQLWNQPLHLSSAVACWGSAMSQLQLYSCLEPGAGVWQPLLDLAGTLQVLAVHQKAASVELLCVVAQLTALSELSLHCEVLNEEDAEAAAEAPCPSFKALQSLRSLTLLHAMGWHAVRSVERAVEVLGQLTGLTHLSLVRSGLSDTVLAGGAGWLAPMRRLEVLDLFEPYAIEAPGLQVLGTLPQLTELFLRAKCRTLKGRVAMLQRFFASPPLLRRLRIQVSLDL